MSFKILAILYTEFNLEKGPELVYQEPDNYVKIKEFNKISEFVVPSTHFCNKEVNLHLGNAYLLGYPIFLKPKGNKEEIVIRYNNEEMNSADFEVASGKDKRTFIQYYWSLLKLKQLCIFTFYTNTDHNLRYVKIALFTLFLSFYFAFTALFFNDSIMRSIYTYKGNTDAAIHVTNIILSSLCTLIMSFIVRFVSLSERDIMSIKRQKDKDDIM